MYAVQVPLDCIDSLLSRQPPDLRIGASGGIDGDSRINLNTVG
jgi:hypothetical protein